MNVLHINEQRTWRGGEQQASYLIRGLGAKGHHAVVAGRPGSGFLARDHGDSVLARVAAPFVGEADLWTAYKLARVVRQYDIDLIHAHASHGHTYACLARLLARRSNVKVVVSRRMSVKPRPGPINRWKYKLPDRFIAISKKIAAVLCAYGIPESKIDIVYSAIDPTRFDTPPIDRTELGIPSGAPLLGNVAALEAHKDQQTLLEALPSVLEAVPGLHVVIAGEGPLRSTLEEQIRAHGLEGVVRLIGYRNDVPAILRALDAFVLCSRQEGLGTSLLDAMICGAPVVATAAGGIPELVQHEQTGLLTPVGDSKALADALIRVLTDSQLAQGIAKEAESMIWERFTVDRMVEGNLRAYEDVLDEP